MKIKISTELCRFEWSIGAKVKRHHIEQTLAMWHNSHLAKQVPGRAVVLQWGDFFIENSRFCVSTIFLWNIDNQWMTHVIYHCHMKRPNLCQKVSFFSFENIKQPIRLICHRSLWPKCFMRPYKKRTLSVACLQYSKFCHLIIQMTLNDLKWLQMT